MTSPPPPDLRLTEKDDMRSFRVEVGTRIRITLLENATTGYRWKLRAFKSSILTLESNEFVPPIRHQIGGSGLRKICFIAKSVGESTIDMISRREWENTVRGRFITTIISFSKPSD